MKYLFIVQGEGRGHLSQALALQQILVNNDTEICCVLVSESHSRKLPSYFEKNICAPLYKFKSPVFLKTLNKKGINILVSFIYNLLKIRVYIKSIRFIASIINHYSPDIVINFYEPLTGLAYRFNKIKPKHITIAHHFLVHHQNFPLPEKMYISKKLMFLLNKITTIGAHKVLALSFKNMESFTRNNWYVAPPLIRKEILEGKPVTNNYIMGYMLNEGYFKDVKIWHTKNKDKEAIFYWDKNEAPEIIETNKTLQIQKIDDKKFITSLTGCKGIITTAGFETVCEALYFGKPIVVVPVKNHFEQLCNAYDANELEMVSYSKDYNPEILFEHIKNIHSKSINNKIIHSWINSAIDFYLRHLI